MKDNNGLGFGHRNSIWLSEIHPKILENGLRGSVVVAIALLDSGEHYCRRCWYRIEFGRNLRNWNSLLLLCEENSEFLVAGEDIAWVIDSDGHLWHRVQWVEVKKLRLIQPKCICSEIPMCIGKKSVVSMVGSLGRFMCVQCPLDGNREIKKMLHEAWTSKKQQ